MFYEVFKLGSVFEVTYLRKVSKPGFNLLITAVAVFTGRDNVRLQLMIRHHLYSWVEVSKFLERYGPNCIGEYTSHCRKTLMCVN